MDYFSIVNLNREPFSNSPDPEFFYQSRQHQSCLQKLELALRLRRGLNVVIGEVGTGKTTLCRQLIRGFSGAADVETYLILDPDFTNPTEFLETVAGMFDSRLAKGQYNDWQLKEFIKTTLFEKGVEKNETVILIIDEGQKAPLFCLELLREFLNYETNEYKLLQIVVFAQKEFENTIAAYANFADRINLFHHLRPMNFPDTRRMIKFRLEKSSDRYREYRFFSFPALVFIYWVTGGYPRKIINLCHRCILTMIIQNKSVVDLLLVRACTPRVFPGQVKRTRRKGLITAAGLVGGMILLILLLSPANRVTRSIVDTTPQIVKSLVPSVRRADRQNSQGAPDRQADHQTVESGRTISDKMAATVTRTLPAAAQAPAAGPAQTTAAVQPAAGIVKSLGQVTVRTNQTLSRLIEDVYGEFNSKYFRAVIMANPQIVDPDVVDVGDTIQLPAIPVNVVVKGQTGWWVVLDRTADIDAALTLMRSVPTTAATVRLLPHWQAASGLQFDLVVEQVFESRQAAEAYILNLPAPLAAGAEAVSLRPGEGVYFADPFFFGRKPTQGVRVNPG